MISFVKLFSVVVTTALLVTGIHALDYTALGGEEKHMSDYRGKKILIVNIASSGTHAPTQLLQLEALSRLYKDSLVVIGFPTNDFGNEPLTNNNLKMLLQLTYHITFPVSVISHVKGNSNVHPVFNWLRSPGENGGVNIVLKEDFQKFLVDGNGSLIGIFSGEVMPMDPLIKNAITQ